MATVKKNILHLITKLPVGGAERVLLSIVRNLDSNKFNSVVCCIMEEGELASEVEKLNIPLITLNLMTQKGWDSQVVPALCNIIKKKHIDLIHSHLYHANQYGRTAARKVNIPAVITVHNSYNHVKLHRRLVNWYLGKKTAAVIAVSDEIKKDIIRWDFFPEHKIHVIANGINIQRAQSSLSKKEARVKLGLNDEQLILVCVGRLEEQKGHKYLLEALPLLNEKGIKPLCLFVGEGRNKNSLEQQARQLNVSAQVRWLGTRHDIADILKSADLYLMPSLWEGLSLALLEAMAAHIPIIASDVSGMKQVLGHNSGVRIPPKQPASIATAIASALNNPEQVKKMTQHAAQFVNDNFSDQRMVKDIATIYHQVTY
ncbi:MAG: glycosyltransferase, partial [Gammaproteobacteria bacterium]|nr:glycosyltransferase [Gammaproteobacteria bacterium]